MSAIADVEPVRRLEAAMEKLLIDLDHIRNPSDTQGQWHNPAPQSMECCVRLPNVVAAVPAFSERLRSLRAPCTDINWYPYNSLDNVYNWNTFVAPTAELVPKRGSVLDIGCADGDMGFLFQSLGCEVDFLDNAATNFNDCKGVKRTAELLGHKGRIIERDIDFGFTLDREYDLALFLGTLYHLRNPALALLRLAEHCEQMLLSTRVLTALPAEHSGVPVANAPVAYLVDTLELNSDSTNWWIFSPSGLTRLLKRCGWTVIVSTIRFDATLPADQRDERMFMLCRRVVNYRDLTRHHHF